MRRIQESEVKDALKRMKGGKAMGSDGIPVEVWRSLGDVAIVWLTKLFNLIFPSNKMPDECVEHFSTNLQEQGECAKLY
jgi:hypothetical protein